MAMPTHHRRLIVSLGAILALATSASAPAQVADAAAGAASSAAPPSVAPAPAAPAAPAPEKLPILADRPDAEGGELLGGQYASPANGIAFHTPGNSTQVPPREGEVARFTDQKRGWDLIVSRRSSAQPLPLSSGKDLREAQAEKVKNQQQTKKPGDLAPAAGSAGAAAPTPPGLLEVVAAQVKNANPGAEILRQDVVNLSEYSVGLIAARFSITSQRKLMQQAIIQANDQLYYTITFITPGAKTGGADVEDAGEKTAVDVFRMVLDSVKLLDRAPILDDQKERLFRTRALFVNLTPQRIKAALIPEQWLRLMRDGKDIGYTYIIEEPDVQPTGEGIKIGIRSRSLPEADVQVDGETWYFLTLDRKHETWSNLAWLQNKKTKQDEQITEFGSSDRRIARVFDQKLADQQLSEAPEKRVVQDHDPKQPAVRMDETYTLNVQTVSKTGSFDPVNRNLPVFYVPQAISHLLPRLLPLHDPKTYLFAVYVGDKREVMTRYIDVGNEEQADLNGTRVRAVPISDKIGLEGAVTIHYMSPEGTYLGSVNKSSKALILPSDGETLQKIWGGNADLTRPKMQERKP